MTGLRILHRLKVLRYRGNRYICPCCGGRFRRFLPYGVTRRANAECPECGSKERHRLLWLFLKNRTDILTTKLRVLHVAPEEIIRKNLLGMSNLDYLSADLVSPLATVRMDITRIPFDDNSFDAILCSHVLEHVDDDHKAMLELCRVLRSGGWAIIQVPLDKNRGSTFEDPRVVSPSERERLFGQKDHVRVYGRDYKSRLERAGFTVRIEGYARELGDDALKFGLDPDEDIYYCTKSGPG
jgi:SAM-dependent methyltransferase/DNA-directed RNA polymerase subunit RPC12/RpoP